jgi:hypothetical protein
MEPYTIISTFIYGQNYLQACKRISTSVHAICQPVLTLHITALVYKNIRFTQFSSEVSYLGILLDSPN